MYTYFNIYINNELAFNNLTTLETLLQLNLLNIKVDIELLQKYSVLYFANTNIIIEVKKYPNEY